MKPSLSRRSVAAIALIAIAAVVGLWWALARPPAQAASAPAPPKAASAHAQPQPRGDKPAAAIAAPSFSLDDDPVGPLRLEGQVLTDGDEPVADAVVWMSSVPPRTTTTEKDGSFAFDRLVGRTYWITARAGDRVGGPVGHPLTASSPPVVIRVRQGTSVTVRVVDESERPVAGAAVTANRLDRQKVTTGADGTAVLHGIDGWLTVLVDAPGFGQGVSTSAVTAGREIKVVLRRGAPVSGRVVDDRGAPIAGARVIVSDASRPWDPASFDGALRTGADGSFDFKAIAAGSYRFLARHDDHAPATTAPITVGGAAPVRGVEIRMKAGASIRGVVQTADHQPAPYATVRVAPKEMRWGAGDARQVTADADGAFTVRGLARTALRVRAESDRAASALVDVDLSAPGERRDLVLTLDVEGTIAGVVVDDKGQPLGDVQVAASPDVLAGAKLDDLALGGFATATSDGDGRFAMHGLHDGAYRVYAQRAGRPRGEGTPARAGDKNVRIVLAGNGGLRGRVELSGGGAPKLASVGVDWEPAVAVDRDGHFEVPELAPGPHGLEVRGPGFATSKREVTIESGKMADVGTVTVERGRTVTGVVTDARGGAVAGARVMVGKYLTSGGDGDSAAFPGMNDEAMGVRTAISDAAGAFTLSGVGADGAIIAAEHPQRGRSDAAKIAAGRDDPAPLTLVVRAFGAVEGIVTAGGAPAAHAMVQVMGAVSDQSVLVTAGDDGRFVIDRLPEGHQRIVAISGSGAGMMTAGTEVDVRAGQRQQVSIDIPIGDVALTVEVRPAAGAKLDLAQLFLLRGAADLHTAKELGDAFSGGHANGGAMKMWMGGDFPVFDKQVAGAVSICAIPITGDLHDPVFQKRLGDARDQLAVYCSPVTIARAPAQQRTVVVLPAMKPLPGVTSP